MWYQHNEVHITILFTLQKRKLNTNINSSKISQLVSGHTGVRTRNLAPRLHNLNYHLHQQWDTELYGNLSTQLKLLSVSWLGPLFYFSVKDFRMLILKVICFYLPGKVLIAQFQCVDFPLHIQSNSPTPDGRATIKFNSDTIYLEIASDSTG